MKISYSSDKSVAKWLRMKCLVLYNTIIKDSNPSLHTCLHLIHSQIPMITHNPIICKQSIYQPFVFLSIISSNFSYHVLSLESISNHYCLCYGFSYPTCFHVSTIPISFFSLNLFIPHLVFSLSV